MGHGNTQRQRQRLLLLLLLLLAAHRCHMLPAAGHNCSKRIWDMLTAPPATCSFRHSACMPTAGFMERLGHCTVVIFTCRQEWLSCSMLLGLCRSSAQTLFLCRAMAQQGNWQARCLTA